MSETVHYKGTLRPLPKLIGETLEEQCKRLMMDKEIPSYYEDYKEFLTSEHYEKMIILEDTVYQVEKTDIDPFDDIFNAHLEENGDIKFELKYYNGGCGFDEAIEEALEKIK